MIIVWILLGFFGLVALALVLPLKVLVSYSAEGETGFRVKYLFLTIFDSKKESPAEQEKKPPAEIRPKERSKGSTAKLLLSFLGLEDISSGKNIKLALREKGLVDTAGGVCSALGDLFSRLFRLVKKGRFRRFDLDITVGAGDAADAAMNYGTLCAVVYPLVALLVPPKKQQVSLRCDYEKAETSVIFDGQLNYRPWSFVAFLMGLVWRYIRRRMVIKDE